MDSDVKKMAIVLGCHRSGTSLISAALWHMGAFLGEKLLVANEENPKGFYENEAIVNFNDRLLSFLGGRWDNPLFNGNRAIAKIPTESLSQWFDEAESLIDANFNGKRFCAIKDPRMCLLLPFWKKVLQSYGYKENEIFYVHVSRHPVEVAKSQLNRKTNNSAYHAMGDNLLETVSLWYNYYLQVFNEIGNNNIYFIYSDFINNPKKQFKRFCKFMHEFCSEANFQCFCKEFVDEKLYHNIFQKDEELFLKDRCPETIDLYERQKALSLCGSFCASDLSGIKNISSPNNFQPIFLDPVIFFLTKVIDERYQYALEKRNLQENLEAKAKEQDNVEKEKELLELKNKDLQKWLSAQHEELQKIQNTISWKVTSPLRYIRKMQRIGSGEIKKRWVKIRLVARDVNANCKRKAPLLSKILYPVLRIVFILFDKILNIREYQLSTYMYADKQNVDLSDFKIHSYQLPKSKNTIKNPKVSIIVPNYNHAPYLDRRLQSIYSQTYQNVEVILLDDCSNDESQEILKGYYNQYPEKTQIIFNTTNSGGVFFQWEKGLRLASGELVWIAESDDWCGHNFLEEMVPFFDNEAVRLAYCKTLFMNADGAEQIWSISDYLFDIDPTLWEAPFVKTAHQLVNEGWAIKNIIPNVGSAVFRNPGEIDLLKDEQWKGMRICGDWVFYLHIIRGGLVGYSPKAINYFRIHHNNTSVATYSKDSYYKEHEVVAQYVNALYKVPEECFYLQKRNLKKHWLHTRNDYSDENLEQTYSIKKIKKTKSMRKPSILMASYGFAAGGGEVFPIQLANLLYKSGYCITFISFEQEPREKRIRQMLNKNIPVVTNFYILNQIINNFGIDIVHSHHAWVDNNIVELLPNRDQCKTVISLHGMYETIGRSDLKKILPSLIDRTSKFVYTAEKNLELFETHGFLNENKFVKIDNALDVYPVNPLNLNDIGIFNSDFVLCLVSRAIPEKGWKEAVETVRIARDISGKSIHLICIGEGEEYDYFLANGHPDFVHLIGFQQNLRDYYAAADMGYLPSRFKGESFPLTVIDCLHSGKPVLASAIGEIPAMLEVNGHYAGVLFSLKQWEIPIDQVAELIARCASDRVYYEEIKRYVPMAAAKFDPVAMKDKYDEVYCELV